MKQIFSRVPFLQAYSQRYEFVTNLYMLITDHDALRRLRITLAMERVEKSWRSTEESEQTEEN